MSARWPCSTRKTRPLGLNVVVFVNVRLSGHGRRHLTEFEETITDYPEVIECYTMAGDMDYLLKVVTHDIDSYERFLRDHLLQKPHVQEAHSNIAMSEVKRTTELLLDSRDRGLKRGTGKKLPKNEGNSLTCKWE